MMGCYFLKGGFQCPIPCIYGECRHVMPAVHRSFTIAQAGHRQIARSYVYETRYCKSSTDSITSEHYSSSTRLLPLLCKSACSLQSTVSSDKNSTYVRLSTFIDHRTQLSREELEIHSDPSSSLHTVRRHRLHCPAKVISGFPV